MKKFEIKNKFSGEVIFKLQCKSFKICIETAVKNNADLRSANLRFANLESADLRFANLESADLRSANLRFANLESADLRSADLRSANLRFANLESADLRSADLDHSAWPLHCGSFNAKADDRLVAQLIHHVAKLNVADCSGGVKESIEHIRKMAISDLFCEYRNDVKGIVE